MSGGSATFDLDIINDLEIRPDRMLVIDLSIAPEGSAYRAAGATTHILNIRDNDAYWSGNIRDGFTERQFRFCMLLIQSLQEVHFRTGRRRNLCHLQ